MYANDCIRPLGGNQFVLLWKGYFPSGGPSPSCNYPCDSCKDVEEVKENPVGKHQSDNPLLQ